MVLNLHPASRPDTSSGRGSHAVVAYVSGVAILAAGALGLDAVLSEGQHFLGPDPAAFWLFAAGALAAELRPFRWLGMDETGEVTGSWTFLMAMTLIGSPLAAAAVTGTLFLAADLRARKPPLKAVFNMAQGVVLISVAAAVLAAFGELRQLHSGRGIELLWFPIAALAGVAAFLTNKLLTSWVISLHQQISLHTVLREHWTGALTTDALLLALSPVFVIAAQRSLVLILFLLATTLVVYRTSRLATSREHDATHDLLTGLPNRRLFDRRLADVLGSPSRTPRVGVVLIDLDGFKAVNDNLGHQVGDLVLANLAEGLVRRCRPADLVAHLGSDEFGVLVSNPSGVDAVVAAAERILQAFDEPIVAAGFPVSVRASAGVAVYPDHADDSELLLHRADEAMYVAKRNGSRLHVYRPDVHAAAISRLRILSDVERALATDALFLEYQPQVSLETGEMAGVEALIRWRHPTVGVVGADVFMPLVEQTELIGPITEKVLREGLHQASLWHAKGHHFPLAVNVSARNLEDPRFGRQVELILAQSGVDPRLLLLEITETTTSIEPATLRRVTEEIAALGVVISIDDFGTGYSSILQLQSLAVGQIKLDRQFVTAMAVDGRNALIVRAILHLAQALDLQTVAEGVEERLVAEMLRDLGCHQAQGFLYARPMPADQLEAWMADRDLARASGADPEPHLAS